MGTIYRTQCGCINSRRSPDHAASHYSRSRKLLQGAAHDSAFRREYRVWEQEWKQECREHAERGCGVLCED